MVSLNSKIIFLSSSYFLLIKSGWSFSRFEITNAFPNKFSSITTSSGNFDAKRYSECTRVCQKNKNNMKKNRKNCHWMIQNIFNSNFEEKHTNSLQSEISIEESPKQIAITNNFFQNEHWLQHLFILLKLHN